MQRLSETVGSWFRRSPRNGDAAPGDAGDRAPVEITIERHDEPKAGLMSMLPGAKRDAAIAELRRGYDQVLDLMQSVQKHLQEQSDRSERMLRIMERVPEALQSLPQQTANQAALIETIGTSLENQNRQARQLNEALNNIARASEHQGEVLGLIQEGIEATKAADEQSLRSMDAMNQTLAQLSQTNHASAQTLRMVTEQTERSTSQVTALLERSQHQLTVLTIASWIVAATALAVAIWAVVTQ